MERLPRDIVSLIGALLPPTALLAFSATARAFRFLAKVGNEYQQIHHSPP